MTARCIHDLVVDQCATCQGHDAPDPFPMRWEGSQTEARYDGSCAHCGRRFRAGIDMIAAADVDGNGASDEWCLLEHTKGPGY